MLQPALRRHQQEQRPSFIYRQARKKLETDGVVLGPAAPKKPRSQEITPLEKPASQLPELPDKMKREQVYPSAN